MSQAIRRKRQGVHVWGSLAEYAIQTSDHERRLHLEALAPDYFQLRIAEPGKKDVPFRLAADDIGFLLHCLAEANMAHLLGLGWYDLEKHA